MEEQISHRGSRLVGLLREKVRLHPLHRQFFYIVFGILFLSGVGWLASEWSKDPELGPGRTVLQIWSMKIHGAALVVYLAFLGSFLTHVRIGNALRNNRVSGFLVIALNAMLALTGWALYYLADDLLREWSSTCHWIIGLSALPLLFGHILLGRRSALKARRESSSYGIKS